MGGDEEGGRALELFQGDPEDCAAVLVPDGALGGDYCGRGYRVDDACADSVADHWGGLGGYLPACVSGTRFLEVFSQGR